MAMGAGVYRFVRRGNECGTASVTNFGTTVEIDHGGGVISRYGHLDNTDLAKYQAMDGQLVAAGDRIGTMGLTGAVRCGEPYLNVQVERNGVLYELDDMTACLDGTAESWPQDQFPAYSRWNEVPEDDGLPDTPYIEPVLLPADDGQRPPGHARPRQRPRPDLPAHHPADHPGPSGGAEGRPGGLGPDPGALERDAGAHRAAGAGALPAPLRQHLAAREDGDPGHARAARPST